MLCIVNHNINACQEQSLLWAYMVPYAVFTIPVKQKLIIVTKCSLVGLLFDMGYCTGVFGEGDPLSLCHVYVEIH